MTDAVVLVRHGETEWTVSGQHTSRTDIPLTERGRTQAGQLHQVLSAYEPGLIVTSPRRRARDTAALAGYPTAEVWEDLREWDYGDLEGRTTAEIRATRPDWSLWRDGAPGGEIAAEVAARADSVIARLLTVDGSALVFSHAHLLRVLAARWLGLDGAGGALFALAPASVSLLGWEREQRVVVGWNDVVSAP